MDPQLGFNGQVNAQEVKHKIPEEKSQWLVFWYTDEYQVVISLNQGSNIMKLGFYPTWWAKSWFLLTTNFESMMLIRKYYHEWMVHMNDDVWVQMNLKSNIIWKIKRKRQILEYDNLHWKILTASKCGSKSYLMGLEQLVVKRPWQLFYTTFIKCQWQVFDSLEQPLTMIVEVPQFQSHILSNRDLV